MKINRKIEVKIGDTFEGFLLFKDPKTNQPKDLGTSIVTCSLSNDEASIDGLVSLTGPGRYFYSFSKELTKNLLHGIYSFNIVEEYDDKRISSQPMNVYMIK